MIFHLLTHRIYVLFILYENCVKLGVLYAIGGYSNNKATNSVERYVPKQNKWELVASLQTARNWFVAIATDDAIFVMGE